MDAQDWNECARISDLPDVDEALRGFLEDPTADNAICVVRAVRVASLTSLTTLAVPGQQSDACPSCNQTISDHAWDCLFNPQNLDAEDPVKASGPHLKSLGGPE